MEAVLTDHIASCSDSTFGRLSVGSKETTAFLAAGYLPSGSLILTHLVAEAVVIWVICLLFLFYTSSCLYYSHR